MLFIACLRIYLYNLRYFGLVECDSMCNDVPVCWLWLCAYGNGFYSLYFYFSPSRTPSTDNISRALRRIFLCNALNNT